MGFADLVIVVKYLWDMALGWQIWHCVFPRYIRSISTNNCNVVIGMAEEDPEILERIKVYLGLFGGRKSAESEKEKITLLLSGHPREQ